MPQSPLLDEKRQVRSYFKPTNSQHPINIFSAQEAIKSTHLAVSCLSCRVGELRREVRFVRTWRKYLNYSQAAFVGLSESRPKSMPIRHEAGVAWAIGKRDFLSHLRKLSSASNHDGHFLASRIVTREGGDA